MAARNDKKSATLTAIDLAAVYGATPFTSPHAVYLAKRHPEAVKRSDSQPVTAALNRFIEPFALKILRETYGIETRRVRPGPSKAVSWLVSSPAAIAMKRYAGLGQTGKARRIGVCTCHLVFDPVIAETWKYDGRPPRYAKVIAEAEMAATGLDRALVVAIVMGYPMTYVLSPDPALRGEILGRGSEFVQEHLLKDVPPPWDGSDAALRVLQAQHPQDDGTFLRADEDAEATGMAREYTRLDGTIKRLMRDQALVEQKLKERIGERVGLLCGPMKGESVAPKITWKAPIHGNPQWKTIAQEMARKAGVVLDEETIAPFRGAPTRKFRVFERRVMSLPGGATAVDLSISDDREEAYDG